MATREAARTSAPGTFGRPGGLVPGLGHEAQAGQHRGHGHRQVDEEHRAPAPAEQVRVGQHPAEHQPHRGREAQHGPVDAERLAPLVPAEHHPERGQHLRCHGRGGGALYDPGGDQLGAGPGQPGGQAGQPEQGDPRQEQALAPEQVAEVPGDDERRGERQHVAGHHPFQLGGAGVQVTADGGERHVDDRHVDHVHERPGDHDDRGEPAPGVTGLRGLPVGDGGLSSHLDSLETRTVFNHRTLFYHSTVGLVKHCSMTGTVFKELVGGPDGRDGDPAAAVAAAAASFGPEEAGADQPGRDRGRRDRPAGPRGPGRAEHAAAGRGARGRRRLAVLARRQQGRPARPSPRRAHRRGRDTGCRSGPMAGAAQGDGQEPAPGEPAAPVPGARLHRPHPDGPARAALLRAHARHPARGRALAAPGGAGLPAAHRHGERLHHGRDRGGGAPAPRNATRTNCRRPRTWPATTSPRCPPGSSRT